MQLCFFFFFTGLVSADSISDERISAVPSCYLFVCKVGKLPLKIQLLSDAFLCTLFKGGKERSESEKEEGSHKSQVSLFPLIPTPKSFPSLNFSDGSLKRFPLLGFLIW